MKRIPYEDREKYGIEYEIGFGPRDITVGALEKIQRAIDLFGAGAVELVILETEGNYVREVGIMLK